MPFPLESFLSCELYNLVSLHDICSSDIIAACIKTIKPIRTSEHQRSHLLYVRATYCVNAVLFQIAG